MTPLDRSFLHSMFAMLQRHVLALLTVILLAALGVQALFKAASEWQDVYVSAGRRWVMGEDIYAAGSSYAYPPFMAMLGASVAALPEWMSRLTWFGTSALGMIVVVAGSWRLANGVPLSRMTPQDRRESIALAIGLAIGLTYTLNAFAHQQTDVLIAALQIGGALLLRTRADISSGSLIGLAAACKATPLLWAPYLLWRRRWIAAILIGVVALVANLIPNVIAASPRSGWWLADWVFRFVLPTQQINVPLGMWASALEYNQSLGGTVQRLINTKLVFTPNVTIVMRPVLDSVTLKLVVYAVFTLLIAVSVGAALRARRFFPGATGLPDRESYEFSLVLILMLLLSPMSGRAHFGTLILPAFCLARVALATRSAAISGILTGAVLLSVVANKDLIGANLYTLFLWSGTTTASAMLLWLGCVIMLWRGAGRPAAHSVSAA
jgi:alpha-1,2-mannosyltransferase